jgi:UrcA family protein
VSSNTLAKEILMTTFTTARPAISRAKFALLMITGGFVGAMGVGASSVAAVEGDAPTLAIHYTEADFANESSVRALYHRIVHAAEQACPQVQTGTRLLHTAGQQCRKQVIDQAVQKINNPRLAAVRAGDSKNS